MFIFNVKKIEKEKVLINNNDTNYYFATVSLRFNSCSLMIQC